MSKPFTIRVELRRGTRVEKEMDSPEVTCDIIEATGAYEKAVEAAFATLPKLKREKKEKTV